MAHKPRDSWREPRQESLTRLERPRGSSPARCPKAAFGKGDLSDIYSPTPDSRYDSEDRLRISIQQKAIP